MYLYDIDFDGKTKQEIEIALSRKALETMLAKALQAHEQAEKERRQSGLLLATIADTLSEIHHWQKQQENMQFDSYYSILTFYSPYIFCKSFDICGFAKFKMGQ